MLLFDTHAHYDDEQFDADREALIASLPSHGVCLVVDPATELESAKAAVALAEKYPHVYAAVGWHPHEASHMTGEALSGIEALTAHPKVVAVGEIGLDYYYDFSPRETQRECFIKNMALARKTGLPAIIHEREASRDCLEIVSGFPDVLGVYHCYSGSWETAKTILSMGWYLSFTGAVTFKNAKKALEVISNMPLDRLMIETDSPYLAPVPMRGRRNDSRNLVYIAEAIGKLRGLTADEIGAITCANGRRFFGIT